jgi:hypothetical protein
MVNGSLVNNTKDMSGGTIAPRRRNYNTQIVTKYVNTH